jgi:hypothetical protein
VRHRKISFERMPVGRFKVDKLAHCYAAGRHSAMPQPI